MSFDVALAKQLAKISLWVYDFDDDALIADHGVAPATVRIQDDRQPPTAFAGVVNYPDRIVVAYQGTITNRTTAAVMDWLQNFRIHLIDSDRSGLPGKVHEGFFGQLDAIHGKVVAELAKAPGKPLYVTGHSQGGAVAALATKRLELSGFTVTETYTFAAPRPGNSDFGASIVTPVFRFEFGNDIVPHVPPILTDFGSTAWSLLKLAAAASEPIARLLRLAEEASGLRYCSDGLLTYRAVDGTLQRDLTAAQESALLRDRVMKLLKAGATLGEHHHLSNYIGMFDD